jgi:hypothetical protein
MNFGNRASTVKTAVRGKPSQRRATNKSRDTAPKVLDQILQHVARYRLTTFAALQQLPAFEDQGPRHIRYALRDCERQDLLRCDTLHPGSRYWFLGERGLERLQREGTSRPFSEHAKLKAAALLHFCCLSSNTRHLLLPEEIEGGFPSIFRPGLPHGYYFDPTDDGRIGLARVDNSRGGRWDRPLQSLRQTIADHWHRTGFHDLIQAGRFEITLLTILPRKARRLKQAVASLPDTRRVPIQIKAIPELLPLLGCCHPATGSFRRKEVTRRAP